MSVPKEFDEKELEIILLSIENEADLNENAAVQNHEEKVKRLMNIVGAAQFPDFPITKYDVYEQ